MSELESLSNTELLERLPPIDKAPILEKLATLGLTRFRNEYGIETPVYENGIVDHARLMKVVGSEVDDGYKWKAPYFDEHHLHWYAHRYSSVFHESDIPVQFRNLPIHKLWVPRQFHDFVHTLTIPSEVPPMEVMRESVAGFKRAFHNYMLVNEAITLRERSRLSVPMPNDASRVHVPGSKRVIDVGEYERRREEFIAELEENIAHGLPPDLSVLSSIELVRFDSVRESLPEIRRHLGRLVVRKHKKRSARPVRLLVERVHQ